MAHPDDDLLFQNPDVLHDIRAGLCVRTVYATAGDADQTSSYWTAREAGARAAYASLGKAADLWTATNTTVQGRSLRTFTLNANPRVSLVFMRLPDGMMDGSGGRRSGGASLEKLYRGDIASMAAVDGSQRYTKQELVQTLGSLITDYAPGTVRTLDYEDAFDGQDHSDHYAVARLARSAAQGSAGSARLLGYVGYPVQSRPSNVEGEDLDAKAAAFYAYAKHDAKTCSGAQACRGWPEEQWLSRRYVLDGGVVDPAFDPVPGGTNVAGQAQVSASSQAFGTGQTAEKAVDGVIDGYPGDYSAEWSTLSGRGGSWLQLAWASPVLVDRVVLADRPNLDDRVLAGRLEFSDGSTVDVGALPDDGTPLAVSFSARQVTGLRFTVTSVSSSTLNTGLAEIQVLTSGAEPAPAPQPEPTPAPSPAALNVAGQAQVSASSQALATGQTAEKAVDGVIDGYPGDYTAEWSTVSGRGGSWLQLAWASPVLVDRVVLADRPNLDDRVLAGRLEFSDGSTVDVGALPDDGTPLAVSFSARQVTGLRFTVTSVSSSTLNTGLAEIQVVSAGAA